MNEKHNYYMKLLEGRAKRLNELLEIAAPTDIICKEIMLLTQIAQPLHPNIFKSWTYTNQKESDNEDPAERFKCATG